MYPISIILPVFNGIRYLEECIGSVLNQSFRDFEFLIVDDCSSDSSYQFLEALNDNRIRLFRNEQNKGLFYNLNFLIKNSQAPLIKLWSQDDVMYPNCIEEIIAFHRQHPAIGFSYTGKNYIDATGNTLTHNKIDDTPPIISTSLHTRIAFITGSIAGNISNVTISKTALDEVGLFNEKMRISGDFEMWVRIAENHQVGFIKKPLIQLRNHKGQLSNQEKYFVFHLKEDIMVYNYLFSYLDGEQRLNGMKLLRKQKLLFYYTLMLKAAFKGRVAIALDFFNTIRRFDNFFVLTYFFIKHRMLRVKPVF